MPRTSRTPIDPQEQELITFDFAPGLSSGVIVNRVVAVSCAVVSGTDPNPQSRVLGPPSIVASPTTGAAKVAVEQLVGNMLAGVLYQLQAVVSCSDNQQLSLRWNLPCSQPPGT
ncbi:MAG TPA: hypothetical protein VMU06_07525 [Stellaceae bacterium]|nr:hypothetical protein [Stellaceae bacterium]